MIIINRRIFLVFSMIVIFTLVCGALVYIIGEASDRNMTVRIIVDAGHEGYELCFNK